MTARDMLIQEISRLPENIVRELLAYLRQRTTLQTQPTGQQAGYWSQYIGAFANEDWVRPEQGTFEVRDR